MESTWWPPVRGGSSKFGDYLHLPFYTLIRHLIALSDPWRYLTIISTCWRDWRRDLSSCSTWISINGTTSISNATKRRGWRENCCEKLLPIFFVCFVVELTVVPHREQTHFYHKRNFFTKIGTLSELLERERKEIIIYCIPDGLDSLLSCQIFVQVFVDLAYY